ncbi:MAG: TM2 domain-containing protein [Vicingaceae bacterium]
MNFKNNNILLKTLSFIQRKDKERSYIKKTLVFTFFLFCAFTLKADNVPFKLTKEQSQILLEAELSVDSSGMTKVKFKRGKAILFTVFTGFLGGHRIYLGTHQRTPVLYSITLGGLGILPLIDLINIIFTKDLQKFEDIPQIIMWGR